MTLIFALLLSWSSHGQVCKAKSNVEKDLPGRQVISILFPDGREYTILGHLHITQDGPEKIEMISNRSQNLPDSTYIEIIKEFLGRNKDAISHARQEKKFLEKNLSRDYFKFVAVEATELDLSLTILPNLRKLNESTFTEFSKRKIIDPDMREDLMLLMGSAAYLKETKPILFKNTSLAGIEDPSAKKINGDFLQAFQMTLDNLVNLEENAENKVKIRNFSYSLLNQIIQKYYQLDQISDDKLLSEILSQAPKCNHQNLVWHVKAGLGFMRALRQRDHNIITNLTEKNGPGLLIIGQGHLPSIAQLLEEKCKSIDLKKNTSSVTNGGMK